VWGGGSWWTLHYSVRKVYNRSDGGICKVNNKLREEDKG
jgi:hypothetical protein